MKRQLWLILLWLVSVVIASKLAHHRGYEAGHWAGRLGKYTY